MDGRLANQRRPGRLNPGEGAQLVAHEPKLSKVIDPELGYSPADADRIHYMTHYEIQSAMFAGAEMGEYRSLNDTFTQAEIYAMLDHPDFSSWPAYATSSVWSAWEAFAE